MHLRGRSRKLGDVVVVELDGDADLAAIPQLAQILTRALIDADMTGVVVDLDGLTVLDDAALGQLIGAAATARRRDLTFALACTNERLVGRLRETRIAEIVEILEQPHL